MVGNSNREINRVNGKSDIWLNSCKPYNIQADLLAKFVDSLGIQRIDTNVRTGLVPAQCGTTTRVARTPRNLKTQFVELVIHAAAMRTKNNGLVLQFSWI
jgi:hypothetical protein